MFSNKKQPAPPSTSGLFVVVLASLASAVLLVGPGMLAVAAVNSRMATPLPLPTMWLAAIGASTIFFALIWWRTSPPKKDTQAPRIVVAWRAYLFLSVLTLGALVACQYAFDLDFPQTYLGYYLGSDTAAQVSSVIAK